MGHTSPTVSPTSTRHPSQLPLQTVATPTGSPSLFTQSLGSPMACAPSPHALIPTSNLRPPSFSSASSSPQISALSLDNFATTFLRIHEPEVTDGLKISLHPTGTSSSGSRSREKPSISHANSVPPMFHPEPFQGLPMDMVPRPSSTPTPLTIDTFQSRPTPPMCTPLSPTDLRKPSYLSMKTDVSSSSKLSTSTLGSPMIPCNPMAERRELPFKASSRRRLTNGGTSRTFQGAAVVLGIEPSILQRDQ